jgi:hypothetical protein
MFSVWSLNRAHVVNNRQASEFLYALDEGRSAQTLFKIQVQEWKNVLLRGAVQADLVRYFDSFKAHETHVQKRLDSLATRADHLGLKDIVRIARSLAEEHRALGQAYRAALAKVPATGWNPFAIDRSVRGIDRKLNEDLDQVATTLLEETERRRVEAARQEANRYQNLRSFLGWSIAVSIAMVGLVLWTVLRRRTDLA